MEEEERGGDKGVDRQRKKKQHERWEMILRGSKNDEEELKRTTEVWTCGYRWT